MSLNDFHDILFNMLTLYSLILGVWAAVIAARNQNISGSFWGAAATYVILALAILIVGLLMTIQGLRPARPLVYFLYMVFLIVIMPGLFSMLHGRDDQNAAIIFSLLAFFNFAMALSMMQRMVITPWS